MNKYLILFIISLHLFSCYASGSDSIRIWGHGAEEIEEAINTRNYDFFDSIQWQRIYRKGQLGDIRALHKGGAYYFSFILEEKGEREWQLRFLEEELLNGLYPEKAEEKIHELLSLSREWDRLAEILGKAYRLERLGEAGESFYIEALWESGQSREALDIAGGKINSLAAVKAYIAEGGILNSEIVFSFLYDKATPEEVAELGYFLKGKGLFGSLDPNPLFYINIMTAYIQKNINELRENLERFLVSESMAKTYRSLVYRLRSPILMTGSQQIWADRFSTLGTFGSLFIAGRLYRSEKMFDKAVQMFGKASESSGSPHEQDRAIWYLMNLFRGNVDVLEQYIENYASDWNDPLYFSDILEDFLYLIVADSRWDILERIYPLIREKADSETTAAFCWVRFNVSGGNPEGMAEDLLKAPHFSFYNIMGHVITGRALSCGITEPGDVSDSEADEFIKGFYLFSLNSQALYMSLGLEDQLSNPLLRRLAQQAAQSGDFLSSIQLAAYLRPDEKGQFSLDDLKLKYPFVYETMISSYSNEYQIPPEILAGIIRTESAYSRDIVSRTGAVGLSQLMPETAEDQARKLNLENPDLTDPETNIKLGSSYVRWILDRPWNDNLSQMLIAYNSGGGNLRKWKRMYPDYSDELFVEAIPYKETRNYVRKVITSSVVYGFIYGEENPRDIIGKIYPDFIKLLKE